jgi:hypothetical protein
MKRISLTQGKFAMVDDVDFGWLSQFKWQAIKTVRKWRTYWYAMRATPTRNGKRKNLRMHREILGLKKGDGKECDHRNGDGLDNQRHNLRICTRSENSYNQLPERNRNSKYKGVAHCVGSKNWQVTICKNGKRLHLGCFKNEIDAAKTYDAKAKELFGEYALLNSDCFPELLETKNVS